MKIGRRVTRLMCSHRNSLGVIGVGMTETALYAVEHMSHDAYQVRKDEQVRIGT